MVGVLFLSNNYFDYWAILIVFIMSFVVFSVGGLVGALVCFGMRWFF